MITRHIMILWNQFIYEINELCGTAHMYINTNKIKMKYEVKHHKKLNYELLSY